MSHKHPVWNDDPLFVIDPDSRTITKESSNGKTQLMQYDHNSEVFRFKIPTTIEGHLITDCDIKQIHYINTGTGTSVSNRESNVGIYEIPELSGDIDGSDHVYFDWLISQNATQLIGDVKFQIKFGCTDPDRPGVVDYMWGSQVYSAVEILPGINNTEIVAVEYVDILQQWKEEIEREIAESGGGSLEDYVKKTDYANATTGGVIKVKNYTHGLTVEADGTLAIYPAEKGDISGKQQSTRPINVSRFDYAMSYGTHQTMSDDYDVSTMKVATDMAGKQGQLPASYDAVKEYVDTMAFTGGSGGSLEGYVKDTDYATLDKAGVVKVATSGNTYGIVKNANNVIQIACATENDITHKANTNKPITPSTIEYAVEVCTLQDDTDFELIKKSRLPISGELLGVIVDNLHDTISEIEGVIGSIDTALDNIIAIQTSLIGGDS